jgi:hypothetical protein
LRQSASTATSNLHTAGAKIDTATKAASADNRYPMQSGGHRRKSSICSKNPRISKTYPSRALSCSIIEKNICISKRHRHSVFSKIILSSYVIFIQTK